MKGAAGGGTSPEELTSCQLRGENLAEVPPSPIQNNLAFFCCFGRRSAQFVFCMCLFCICGYFIPCNVYTYDVCGCEVWQLLRGEGLGEVELVLWSYRLCGQGFKSMSCRSLFTYALQCVVCCKTRWQLQAGEGEVGLVAWSCCSSLLHLWRKLSRSCYCLCTVRNRYTCDGLERGR